jgi:hypothetical protein
MSAASQFVTLHQEPYINVAKAQLDEKTAYTQ